MPKVTVPPKRSNDESELVRELRQKIRALEREY